MNVTVPLSHGSLFSGIGGFDLASEWMGWENLFHCEWNDFGKQVLQYYWPNAKSYDDITKTDFSVWRGKVDVLTGGFPCQPYSVAGKRKGTEDDRHLWPEMLRAIREIQPSWVVGENVPGIISWNGGLVFEEVCIDLENEGYEVQPIILPAASKDAPHKRDRVWFIAYSHSSRLQKKRTEQQTARIEQYRELDSFTSDPDSERWNDWGNHREERQVQDHSEWSTPKDKSKRNRWKRGIGQVGEVRDATNSNNERLQRVENRRSIEKSRKNRNEFFAGLLPSNWQNFPTQSPICDGDDGFPARLDGITFPKWRNESIKAGGNAIVPQVAFQIFKAINEFHSSGA